MTQTAGPLPTIKFRCARCQQLLRVPGESFGNNARCPECQLLMQIPEPRERISSLAVDDELHPGLPWERAPRKRLSALLATAKRVSFHPLLAFSQMKQQGSLQDPILYSTICLACGLLAYGLWSTLFLYLFLTYSGFSPEYIDTVMTWAAVVVVSLPFIVAPLWATLGNLMSGGILHICLIFCGGSRRPFATSFRIACYSQSSLMWLLFIPLGESAVGIWNLILTVFAVHKSHEVPLSRAVLTALLPLIVMFVVGLVGFVILACVLAWYMFNP
jgi:hypothetical protein